MISSMWSGVSGLRSHQTKMDVIGNDVANVNTLGFKQSDVTFQDAFYNTLSSDAEGKSGQQVGLGVGISKISQDFNNGLLQSTAKDSHMAISGDGFFVMKDVDGNNATYTRAGDFEPALVNGGSDYAFLGPDGKYLYGTLDGNGGGADAMITIPADAQGYTISNKGVVSYTDSTGALIADHATVGVANFASKGGLEQVGGNQYAETTSSGTPSFNTTDVASYDVYQGYLENSNVDLAKEFTEMIVAERGFQANSRTITTSDSMLQELLNLKR